MLLLCNNIKHIQIDKALKSRVGMAMGLFEMGDLAGNDVGWRLRQGLNLVGRFGISLITHCDDYEDG
jgi:3-hydroxyacyl-CoA dehydrogenase